MSFEFLRYDIYPPLQEKISLHNFFVKGFPNIKHNLFDSVVISNSEKSFEPSIFYTRVNVKIFFQFFIVKGVQVITDSKGQGLSHLLLFFQESTYIEDLWQVYFYFFFVNLE